LSSNFASFFSSKFTMDVQEQDEPNTIENSINNMKNSISDVQNAPKDLLPPEITAQMGDVDAFVEEFVDSASVANWSSDDAKQIIEQWDNMREGFHTWSHSREMMLLERTDEIRQKQSALDQQKKTYENMTLQEKEIRINLNAEVRRRQQLEEQQAAINERIKELKSKREKLLSDFDISTTNSEELETQLREVVENQDLITSVIGDAESHLQEIEDDNTLLEDEQQHGQFLIWKEGVEKVMNEIQKARELEWKKWEPQEIVDWICRLDHGVFRVYKTELEKEIPEKIDIGEDLLYLTRDRQIIRELGVTKIRHRDMLIQHIVRLNRNNPSKNEKGKNPNV